MFESILIEALPENVTPLQNFFNKKFIWLAGEYVLKVRIITDKEMANVEKLYKFTLFEYYEEELRKITDEFKYGAGIFWDSATSQSVIIDIKEA